MKITRADAVELCVALGFKTAGKWAKERMVGKLKDLAGMVEDGGIEVPEEDENAERLNVLLQKIADAKGEVDVVKELPAEEQEPENGFLEEEEAAEEPIRKPVGRKKRSRAEEPVRKTTAHAGLDRFGNRMGTQAHKINEVMTKKGISMDEICKVTGLLKPRVASHVAYLVKTGRVKKIDGMVKVVS